MLKEGLAIENEKKKKRRKWVRYEREHSISAGHNPRTNCFKTWRLTGICQHGSIGEKMTGKLTGVNKRQL